MATGGQSQPDFSPRQYLRHSASPEASNHRPFSHVFTQPDPEDGFSSLRRGRANSMTNRGGRSTSSKSLFSRGHSLRKSPKSTPSLTDHHASEKVKAPNESERSEDLDQGTYHHPATLPSGGNVH